MNHFIKRKDPFIEEIICSLKEEIKILKEKDVRTEQQHEVLTHFRDWIAKFILKQIRHQELR
jgi:hypothetical protein